jgi:hypothetical protein
VRRTICLGWAIALCACQRARDEEKTVELPLPKVTVHVIDPGAEPRAPLRYHSVYKPVVLKATYRVTTEKGLANTITRSLEASREQGADGVFHEHEQELDGNGATIDAWFDAREIHPRPTVERGTKVHAEGGSPELQEIFPEEPVGVGARWHEDIAIGASTASVDVELVSRDGDRARERITYHSDGKSPTQGWPMHHDGTVILELDLGGVDPSVHMEETYVIDKSSGKVGKGSMTMDIVKQ